MTGWLAFMGRAGYLTAKLAWVKAKLVHVKGRMGIYRQALAVNKQPRKSGAATT